MLGRRGSGSAGLGRLTNATEFGLDYSPAEIGCLGWLVHWAGSAGSFGPGSLSWFVCLGRLG